MYFKLIFTFLLLYSCSLRASEVTVIELNKNKSLDQLVLEQENTSRGEQLEALNKEAINLRKKLEELLQIEATLMDKNRSTQQ